MSSSEITLRAIIIRHSLFIGVKCNAPLIFLEFVILGRRIDELEKIMNLLENQSDLLITSTLTHPVARTNQDSELSLSP